MQAKQKGQVKEIKKLQMIKKKIYQFVAKPFICVCVTSQMWHYNCEPSDRKGDAIICSEREVMCIRCGRRGDAP